MRIVRLAYRPLFRFLTSNRHGIALSLLMQALAAKPSDLEAPGGVVRRVANYLPTPFAAAFLLGTSFSAVTSKIILTMPGINDVPGTDLVAFLSTMEKLTMWGATVLAFGAIYASALWKGAWLAMLSRGLSLAFPVGSLPPLRWHLMRASYGVAAFGVLVYATGYLFDYGIDGNPAALNERLNQTPKSLVIGVSLAIVLYNWLRTRNERNANLEIWGTSAAAFWATLISLIALLGIVWLLGRALPVVLGVILK